MTPRAAAVKDGRRANPSLDQRLQAILDGGEHGVTLNVVGADRGWRVRARRSEGNLRSVKAKPRSTTLYSVSSLKGLDHDAVMRIGGRFRGGGSNLQKRHKGQGGHRRTATSDRLGAAPAQPRGRRT
jgi:hypothetical protein